MKSSPLFVLALAATTWANLELIEQRQTNWTVGQVVQTTSGPVTGHAAKNDSQVSEYLGIPFAKTPIGDLRFAAPVAFNGTAPLPGDVYVRSLIHLS